MQYLANDQFPSDIVAILLRPDDAQRSGHPARGGFIALTKTQLEEAVHLCGVRADAVLWLDDLDEKLRTEVFLPLIAARASHLKRTVS